MNCYYCNDPLADSFSVETNEGNQFACYNCASDQTFSQMTSEQLAKIEREEE